MNASHDREFSTKIALFCGADIFKVFKKEGGKSTHKLGNIKIEFSLSPHALRKMRGAVDLGVGVYACFFENKLFYVGIFAGNAGKKIGNVMRERWRKHIEGMTLRGRKVTLCKKAISKIVSEGEYSEESLAASLLRANVDVLSKDQGCQSTYAKYRFAKENWQHFQNLSNDALKDFQFAYISCVSEYPSTALSKKVLKSHLELVESAIVKKFGPPCNSRSKNETGKTEHSMRVVIPIIQKALAKGVQN